MKTIIKIVVAVVVINAAFQAGRAYMSNYQFEDDMQQVALFAGARPKPDEMANRVMEAAEIRGIPLTRDNLEVTMDRRGVNIKATYSVNVELVPKTYTHTFLFAPSVSARIFNAPQ